ncbi:MAG TPA: hypothetical protein ENH57_00545 [Actinobacteria bacterium]|nr:hypothetical protein [Actinomycetota bacterium]
MLVRKQQMVKKQETDNKYNKIARYVLIGFLFLQPLIINPYGWNIYAPLRVLLLYTTVSVLLLLKVYSIWSAKSFSFYRLKALKWLSFFAGALILSTLFSIHLPSSLFGHYPRFEGLFTWISYLLIFLFVLDLFAEEKHIMTLIKALAISSILISLYGLAQFFGYDIISWGAQVMAVKRSFASLGNPIFLGMYLVLIAPINLYFGLKKRSLFFISAAALNIVALVSTLSLGAWLGFIVALVALIFVSRETILNYRRAIFLIVAPLIAVVIVASFMITPGFKEKVGEIVQGRGSFESRVLLYKSAAPMFAQRPLLGSGPDTFYIAFTQNLTPQYERKVSRRTVADRAHNNLLQILVTMGLLALIPFIAFFIFLFNDSRVALKSKKDDFFKDLLKATLAGALGFFVALQTFFGSVDISALFWAVLGLLGISIAKLNNIDRQTINIKIAGISKQIVKQFTAGALIILVILSVVHGFRLVVADYFYRQAKLALGAGYQNDSFFFFEKAEQLTPFSSFYLNEYGKALTSVGEEQKNEIYLKRATEKMDKLNQSNRFNSYYYLDAGRAYRARYRLEGNKQFLKKAMEKFSTGLRYDENYSVMRFEMALIQADLGFLKTAAVNIEKALETKAYLKSANVELAKIYKGMGDIQKAKHYAAIAVQKEPENKELRIFHDSIKTD